MSYIRRMVLRLRAVFLFGRLQREMDNEMRAHLDLATDRYMARGLSRADARVAARREFGNATMLAADARAARGARWSESFATDVRLALRGLRRTPLFAAVAVLSIAIGVGATTAILTIANALLFRAPAGVASPDRVLTLAGTRNGHGFNTISYPTYLAYARATSLTGLAAVNLEPQALSLLTTQGSEAVKSSAVSGSFFGVLGARPELGRLFGADEDSESNAASVVVLSDAYWRKRFHADSAVVGRIMTLKGTPFTIVGVASRGFQGPFVIAPDLWMPMRSALRLDHNESVLTDRRDFGIIAIGRLAPSASIHGAQAELATITERLKATYPKTIDGIRVSPLTLVPGDGHQIIAGFMAVLFVVAALVLFIASANVAGMLLARATARQREIAVRIAMGASRFRIARQLITESLVLGSAAAVLGVLLAKWLVQMLMSLVPRLPIPLVVHPTLDGRVLAFALGITLFTAIVTGLLPALQSTKPDLAPALKLDAGSTPRRQRLRSALVASQIATSMLLLVIAALFGRALVKARAVDPGFQTHRIDVVNLDLSLAGYDEHRGVTQAAALLDVVRRMPGVERAALSAMVPLAGSAMGFGAIDVVGHPAPELREGSANGSWSADWNVVSPSYFDVLDLPLVHGRSFSDTDREGAPNVAIWNETFAKSVFGTTDVVGRTFHNDSSTVTIIGVARDAKYRALDDPPMNFVYVPMSQYYRPHTNLFVRVSGNQELSGPLKRLVAQFDPRLPVLDQSTMDDQVAFSLFPQQLALWITGSLGLIALLLALLGIYGVIAYSVAQRTREIGVRIALGAARGAVLRMVLREGIRTAAVGLLVGALVAFGATRLLASFLFGVPPADVVAFGGAAALLAAVAVIASWLPARRAAAVDPMIALRAE
ncbi:MAG: ADOP family duplicated permease [Gemmatimonadaceae bacterium]